MTHSIRNSVCFTVLAVTLSLLLSCQVFAQGSAFTYQGNLNNNNVPGNGNFDFEFKLFDLLNTGFQQGATVQKLNVPVTNGNFTVTLDFGAAVFSGAPRFLEISVRTAGGGAFTVLTPRQPITATPYAIKSATATAADGLSAACVGCVTGTQIQAGGAYINNTTTQQAGANFNIGGNGAVGGNLIATGNVGVGTSTPGFKMHVQGSADSLLIYGQNDSADANAVGVAGSANNGFGIYGTTVGGKGVVGRDFGASGYGMQGIATSGTGVRGDSTMGRGVWGQSDTWQGVFGLSNSNAGVVGESNLLHGMYGVSHHVNNAGVYGTNDANGFGVAGISVGGTGVKGDSTTGRGVWGQSNTWQGVFGLSNSNAGIAGESNLFHGMYGVSHHVNNAGVYGTNDANGFGVAGISVGGTGVKGDSTTGRGVWGQSNTWQGVFGLSNSNAGVVGESNLFHGMYGVSHHVNNAGVYGTNDANGFGVAGLSNGGIGVQGDSASPTGFGGRFVNSGGGKALRVEGVGSIAVVEITGGSDFSENFDISSEDQTSSKALLAEIRPGLLVSIDAKNPGKLAISQRAYDRLAAGIISGAGDIKPGIVMGQEGSIANGTHPVALTGRVYCWADASYGAIKPGDLLTTSRTPGHAMKVTNHAKSQGAVIGKAMTGLKSGKGLVLVLVTLQ